MEKKLNKFLLPLLLTSCTLSTYDFSESSSSGSSGMMNESSSSGSSGILNYCGNLIVENDEECEINEKSCNSLCIRDRHVFITSQYFRGDSFYHPLAKEPYKLMNDYCKQLAGAAKLENADSYDAWVSAMIDAKDNIFLSKGRYILLDGTPIASNFEDLLDGNLLNPINLSEKFELVESEVWTGTDFSGTGRAENCNYWSTGSPFSGVRGSSWFTDSRWTEFDESVSCNLMLHLYCFEGE